MARNSLEMASSGLLRSGGFDSLTMASRGLLVDEDAPSVILNTHFRTRSPAPQQQYKTSKPQRIYLSS